MKIVRAYIVNIIFLSVVLMSCEDAIDWKVDSDQIKLVVEGRVTTELKQHQITLITTADYFNSGVPKQVEGAQVVVNDGVDIFSYQETEPGIYVSANAFAGVVGRKYSLAIQLQTPLGGSSVFVASSTMLPTMKIDSLYNIKEPTTEISGEVLEDSVYVIGFYGQEVEEVDNSYLYEVFSNGVLETDTISNLGWFDDDFLEGTYFEDFLLYQMDDGNPQDSVSIFMYSVEDEYIEFIEALVQEADGSGPLGLNGPPANVVGNLSNGGLGYFYAASVDKMSTILGE